MYSGSAWQPVDSFRNAKIRIFRQKPALDASRRQIAIAYYFDRKTLTDSNSVSANIRVEELNKLQGSIRRTSLVLLRTIFCHWQLLAKQKFHRNVKRLSLNYYIWPSLCRLLGNNCTEGYYSSTFKSVRYSSSLFLRDSTSDLYRGASIRLLTSVGSSSRS